MSGNIFNKQGFGIPAIIRDGEDYLSLTAMCKDCRCEPMNVIRNFLSNKDNLQFIITRQITNDPEYLATISNIIDSARADDKFHLFGSMDDAEFGQGEIALSNLSAVIDYINIMVNIIKEGHTRVSVEILSQDYGVTGFYVKRGGRKNQGIYAHHDIALHFATWLNPAYGVFVNRDYQRLKNKEMDELLKRGVEWKFSRRDAALWHRLLETTVRTVIVPRVISLPDMDMAMISEEQLQGMSDEVVAGMMMHISNCINVAVFGMTAQQWREENPGKKGNMRDYADENDLNLISYLEYRMIMIVAEEPQHCWRKTIAKIAKKCRKTGNYEMMSMFSNTGIITDNEPVSHDARTMTSLESMQSRFLKELSTGEVHQCDDGYFRNNEGYIILAPKFK